MFSCVFLVSKVVFGNRTSKVIGMDRKGLAATTLNHIRLFDTYAFFRSLFADVVAAIIEYHRVCPLENFSGDPNLVVTPETFEKHMKYFSSNYQILSMDDLIDLIRLKKCPLKKSVVITIDDGYRDIFVHAYPVLERYKIPATIFLVSDYVNTDRPFWWDTVGSAIYRSSNAQLNIEGIGRFWIRNSKEKFVADNAIMTMLRESPERRRDDLIARVLHACQVVVENYDVKVQLSWDEVRKMYKGGVKFGSHSKSHPRLTDISLERARSEIVESKQVISDALGEDVTIFSYPFGDYNTEILNLVHEAKFVGAVGSLLPYRVVGLEDNPLSLQRIPAVKDLNKLRGMLSGFVGDMQTYVTRGPV